MLLSNLSNAGADAAEGQARRILLGLGFTPRQMDSPVSQLSGQNSTLPCILQSSGKCILLSSGPQQADSKVMSRYFISALKLPTPYLLPALCSACHGPLQCKPGWFVALIRSEF